MSISARAARPALALALASAVVVPVVGATEATAATKKTTITLSGSTSVYPVMADLTKSYQKLTKNKVRFRVTQGGSDKGVTDVSKGSVTLGMSSRDPKSDDPKTLNFNRIARDAVCVITNRANPLGSVPTSRVADIFSGKVRSWADVPGARQSGTINIQARNEASGTLDAFEKLFLGDAELSDTAARQVSNGLIHQNVKRDAQAVGFVSLEFTKGVSVAKINGVSCNLKNAKSGKYKGTRSFWLVSKGRPKGESGRFINWIQKSAAAKKIVTKHAVPLR